MNLDNVDFSNLTNRTLYANDDDAGSITLHVSGTPQQNKPIVWPFGTLSFTGFTDISYDSGATDPKHNKGYYSDRIAHIGAGKALDMSNVKPSISGNDVSIDLNTGNITTGNTFNITLSGFRSRAPLDPTID